MSACLLALLLAAPEAGEEEAWRALVARFETSVPEPEPPPGLRAPEGTERHARAAEAYGEALTAWRRAEEERRERFVGDCTAFLAQFPASAHRPGVLYLRGGTHFRAGSHADARKDFEAFLATGPEGADAAVARKALVASCRAVGDYAAALRHAGPDADPDLLEEAGEVDRAILAAEEAGAHAKAAGWRAIGKKFPHWPEPPPEGAVVIVEAGVELPPERKKALRKAFGAEILGFFECPAEQKGLYVLDSRGIIRSVNPRPETLHHRVAQLAPSAK